MNTKKIILPLKCVKCGKELKPAIIKDFDGNLFDNPYCMIDGGAWARLYTGYGSKHDGCTFQIGICDACIDEVKLPCLGDDF